MGSKKNPTEEINLTKVVGTEILNISFISLILNLPFSFAKYFFSILFCIINMLVISVTTLKIIINITAVIFDFAIASGRNVIINTIFTISITILSIGFRRLLLKLNGNKSKVVKDETKVPFGFFLCVSNILVIIISNFIINYTIIK